MPGCHWTIYGRKSTGTYPIAPVVIPTGRYTDTTWGVYPGDEPGTGQFKPYAPGFIHIDWFYLPRLEGKRRYCILAIDRATRWLVVGFYDSMSKANSIDFLRRLERELPFTVATILTDNGGCFTNRWYAKSRGGARKTADFTAYCQSLGIAHRLTQFRHPWTNGLAENTVKQIKTNTTQYHHLADYFQAEACIDAYVLYHNYRKRHRALGWRTSYETVCSWYEYRRDIFRSDPAVTLRPNRNNLVKLTIYRLLPVSHLLLTSCCLLLILLDPSPY
ncbi:hypothetical protein BRC19_03585 [Candidatus Saccharibacteria bacterium QS_5_54_17]|nr:MAG: hypothetical protein BRC19_03585 [Candidatus Saccharibacteria bacterium QS_5_54_17]